MDDEEGGRVACRELLGRDPRIAVVEALTHPQALERTTWEDVDVVLLDAGDMNNERDNIPGAFVAKSIRAQHPASQGRGPTIVVLTAYHREGSVLLRMKDAGADYIESRAKAMRSAEALQQVVLAPHQLAEPNPPEGMRATIGLRPGIDSNDVVAALNDVGAVYQIGPQQLAPNAYVRVDEPDRPRWASMKAALARYLDPRDAQGQPMRRATFPQKIQIRRVWHDLTRLKDDR